MKLEIIDLQKFYPIDKNTIKRILKTILKGEKKDAELNIVFMDNKGIKEINKTFLGHNYATDVLSFAYNEPFLKNKRSQHGRCNIAHPISPPSQRGIKKLVETSCGNGKKKFLQGNIITGEIIISVEMAIKLAQKRGDAVEGEIALYLIHGLLHLLGYDDKQKKEAKKMHQQEEKLLSNFGYCVPVPN